MPADVPHYVPNPITIALSLPMSQRAATKVGYEPIPGYTLRKRLGAGGYGDVWLADAPGGLQKAIKLIYGTVDQTHAVSELKSLERLRQVYHPFLLSLERIEVVDNQVVIVTELAEGSLLDRFEQHRRKGNPGIPRAVLLDFLRDTADALDFLAQKHSLQHLDVKPGNLLIIADRIKVADFGLVKDLHEKNQSLVSGLTPTYSAPEIFDGSPDIRSDQYSLAIVYMEMLTGHLPFNGKSTGELARQHIDQTPDLDALPPADRPVVARALAKNPLDRFANCRLFIDQLLKTRGGAIPNLAKPAAETTHQVKVDLKSDRCRTWASPNIHTKLELQDALQRDGLIGSKHAPRCMFIGVGGIGCATLMRLSEAVNRNFDCHLSVEDHAWLAIDSTTEMLDEITNSSCDYYLPSKCAIQLPIQKPSDVKRSHSELFSPISRRWLYNVPRSLSTEGVRPVAILSLLVHYEALKHKLRSDLKELVSRYTQDKQNDEPLRIYVLSSLHGGTGSALFNEIGLLVRRIMHELSFSRYRISAVVSAASTTNNSVANLPAAAALASLSELSYLMQNQVGTPSIHYGETGLGTSQHRPFDWVTLVDGGLHGNPNDAHAAVTRLVRVVFLDSQTLQGSALAENRLEGSSKPMGWLRTACADPLQIGSKVDVQDAVSHCVEHALVNAIDYFASTVSALSRQKREECTTQSASQELVTRLLRELDIVEPQTGIDVLSTSEPGNRFLSSWARRMSSKRDLVVNQNEQDVAIWENAIASLVQMRVYSWKQIEQIQQEALDAISHYTENHSAKLSEFFAPFSGLLGTREIMEVAARNYLLRLHKTCSERLKRFQGLGLQRAADFRSWCTTLGLESKTEPSAWRQYRSELPPHLQLIANRLCAQLETTLHQRVTLLFKSVAEIADTQAASQTVEYDGSTSEGLVPYALSLFSKFAFELAIDEALLQDEPAGLDEMTLEQLPTYFPSLSQGGGKVYRFVLAPTEQFPRIESFLEDSRLARSTTLLPSLLSTGAHVACDVSQLAVPQLIASLWRPVPATFQLAEKLRTRIDIEWDPIGGLLDRESPASATEAISPVSQESAPSPCLSGEDLFQCTTPLHPSN